MADKTVHYTLTDSPLGQLLIARNDRGVCLITWAEDPDATLEAQQRQHPQSAWVCDDASLQSVVAQIQAYLSGETQTFDVELDLDVTAFQADVLAQLGRIPYGETRTYAQVAQAMGKPRASRAVGNACARNPIPIIIPCHRVLHTSGNKMGYAGGVDRKHYLLDLERQAAALLVST